jgi:hypothetical protein
LVRGLVKVYRRDLFSCAWSGVSCRTKFRMPMKRSRPELGASPVAARESRYRSNSSKGGAAELKMTHLEESWILDSGCRTMDYCIDALNTYP